ncbi:hypothetical protein LRP49_03295 [Enterovibrio sp. ZSDZ35]|uniref:Uncharacterized protein n=1 Tax=Enterovibrio qingdaonensis TaxID=2899818 RepID=A0ABT5QGX6_9GAMM|nr:hypothetical protein [Enterovibrio sp. ZSDZ35]MDD1780218.1 hypothetical protein [Enterovibrio sp. ZSDZ35]
MLVKKLLLQASATLAGLFTFAAYFKILQSTLSQEALGNTLMWLFDVSWIRDFLTAHPRIDFNTLSVLAGLLQSTTLSLIAALIVLVIMKGLPRLIPFSDYVVLGTLMGSLYYIVIAMFGYHLALKVSPYSLYASHSYGTLITVLTWTLPFVIALLTVTMRLRNTTSKVSRINKPLI